VDPLADTGPPRHIIESDEEEDEHNPLKPVGQVEQRDLDVEVVGDLPQGIPLIVASGQLGKQWARGADLGEQLGAVFVNKKQVGFSARGR
jgi:hypothetical protein